ncbi:MAG: Gfo/Idh/MocA family oxidoreductase, partial [Acidimicrobiales bacterium]
MDGSARMDNVRLGVLGAGNIADLNVAGYLEHPNCEVLAVCDIDSGVVCEAGKRWRVPRVYSDIDDLLSDEDISAVEILTPTHLHHAHIRAALEAGKHVSVQKPITNSVDEALELGRMAEEAGLTLRVSECLAHYPPLELAKQLIVEGAIGRPTGLRIHTVVGQTDSSFQANLRPEGYGWRLDGRSPGG